MHRFAAGHSVEVVLAAGDQAYKGNNASGPVTVVNDPAAPNVLTLPSLAVAVPLDAPTPVVPEAPVAVLLPLAALGLGRRRPAPPRRPSAARRHERRPVPPQAWSPSRPRCCSPRWGCIP